MSKRLVEALLSIDKETILDEATILNLLHELSINLRKVAHANSLIELQQPMHIALRICEAFIPCAVLRAENVIAHITCDLESLTEEESNND